MKKVSMFSRGAILCLMTLMVLSSCGPYKTPRYVNIGTNETGFLVPLEQGTQDNQQAFKSVEYLEKKKIAAKRVYIDQLQLSTGRASWDYKYIPTDTVVIVHRAPVTREWTKAGTGTAEQDQVINVGSKESIGFDIPVNCTASVLEEDAATFLYHFGGQNIEWVMDHNVRPYILDLLTVEFGKLTLDEGQQRRDAVYDTMKVRTQRFFKDFGLTIVNLGVAGQFTYTDGEIQTAINTKFISEMKITAAKNEAAAAIEFAKAADPIKKQKDLDASVGIKNAIADAIRNGKLTWPNTLVMGQGQSLMDIWAAKNLNSSTTEK